MNQIFNSKQTKEYHHKNLTSMRVSTVNRTNLLIKVLKLLKQIKHQMETQQRKIM